MTDHTISFDHLVLAAAAEGLGTCWIANFDPKVVSEVLEIPPQYEPLLLTPLGYPGARDRKPLNEIICWERWSENERKNQVHTVIFDFDCTRDDSSRGVAEKRQTFSDLKA